MDSLTVDNTYGQALFDAANDRSIVDVIGEEYKAVTRVFADHPMLKKLFMVPTLSALHKREVAEKVFSGRISQEMLNFIYILINKRRIDAWDAIGRHFEKLVWEQEGLTKGIIYSAVPMDEERLKALEAKAGEALGKRVLLESRIDRSLIGGARIYVDGKLIDASVRTRLETIKQRMRSK
jgi:ATP synthase F1 delta subunit